MFLFSGNMYWPNPNVNFACCKAAEGDAGMCRFSTRGFSLTFLHSSSNRSCLPAPSTSLSRTEATPREWQTNLFSVWFNIRLSAVHSDTVQLTCVFSFSWTGKLTQASVVKNKLYKICKCEFLQGVHIKTWQNCLNRHQKMVLEIMTMIISFWQCWQYDSFDSLTLMIHFVLWDNNDGWQYDCILSKHTHLWLLHSFRTLTSLGHTHATVFTFICKFRAIFQNYVPFTWKDTFYYKATETIWYS